VTKDGYGSFRYGGGMKLAHRVVWELTYGPIPELFDGPLGTLVCHHCDNRICVRPDHLFLGSCADNVHDSINKGRFIPSRVRGEASGLCKVTTEIVREIRRLHSEGVSQRDLAAQFKISNQNVACIVLRQTWKHVA
jgi:hypothetical protein